MVQICLLSIEQENHRFCSFCHLYWNFLICSEYSLMDDQLGRAVETVEGRKKKLSSKCWSWFFSIGDTRSKWGKFQNLRDSWLFHQNYCHKGLWEACCEEQNLWSSGTLSSKGTHIKQCSLNVHTNSCMMLIDMCSLLKHSRNSVFHRGYLTLGVCHIPYCSSIVYGADWQIFATQCTFQKISLSL